jgi:hypothetical protein
MGKSGFAGSKLVALDLASLRAVDIWLCWEEAGGGAMLTHTTLTTWLHWEQAGNGEILTASVKCIFLTGRPQECLRECGV